jgi:hypothetical protein
LIGDSEDAKYLDSLSMFDRELLISERTDRREVGQREYELKLRMYKLKVKKRQEARDAKARAAREALKKSSRRLTREERKKLREEEEDGRKQRERDAKKSLSSRARLASDSESSSDSDSDSAYSDSDYEDGGRRRSKRDSRSGRRSRGKSGRGYLSDSDSDVDMDGTGGGQREGGTKAGLDHLRRAQLTRETICQMINLPFFEEAYTGSYVAYNVTKKNAQKKVLRVCKVLGFGTYKKSYHINRMDPTIPNVTTNRTIILEAGGQPKTLTMHLVSNQIFSQREMQSYERVQQNSGLNCVTVEEIEEHLRNRKDLIEGKKAAEKSFEETIKQNQATRDAANVTRARLEIRNRKKLCQQSIDNEGDPDGDKAEEMAELNARMARLDKLEKARKDELRRDGKAIVTHRLNQRNVKASVARMELAAAEVRDKEKNAKDGVDEEVDPFHRRPTRPGILWNTGKEKGDVEEGTAGGGAKAGDGDQAKARQEKEQKEKEKRRKAEAAERSRLEPNPAKALLAAHNFEIDLTRKSQDLSANATAGSYSAGSKAPPAANSITLEEYLARM